MVRLVKSGVWTWKKDIRKKNGAPPRCWRSIKSVAWRVIVPVKFSIARGICTTVSFAVRKQNAGPLACLVEKPSASAAHMGAFVQGEPTYVW